MPKKLTRIPVIVDEEQVGAIYLRHLTWYFDRQQPFRKQFNLHTHDSEEVMR